MIPLLFAIFAVLDAGISLRFKDRGRRFASVCFALKATVEVILAMWVS